MLRFPYALVLLMSTLIPAIAPPQAFADADDAQPITRAREIRRPGVYEVRRTITADRDGNALLIAASNVTLNLSGHALQGLGTKEGVGIRLAPGVSNVRVFNGSIVGFGIGVEVAGASNVRIENLQISAGDQGGPPPGEVGVLIVNSRAVVVEHNVITGVFLGLFVRGGGSGGNRLANNTVTGGNAGQLGICYNPDGSGDDRGPGGDLVYNNLVSRFVIGIQTSAATAGNIFRENSIAAFSVPVQEITPGSNLFDGNLSTVIVP